MHAFDMAPYLKYHIYPEHKTTLHIRGHPLYSFFRDINTQNMFNFVLDCKATHPLPPAPPFFR
jgi:hypothetical protein